MKLNEQLLTFRHLLLYFCTLGLSWMMAGIVPSLLVFLLVILVISISSLCDEKHENLRYLPLLLWLRSTVLRYVQLIHIHDLGIALQVCIDIYESPGRFGVRYYRCYLAQDAVIHTGHHLCCH